MLAHERAVHISVKQYLLTEKNKQNIDQYPTKVSSISGLYLPCAIVLDNPIIRSINSKYNMLHFVNIFVCKCAKDEIQKSVSK